MVKYLGGVFFVCPLLQGLLRCLNLLVDAFHQIYGNPGAAVLSLGVLSPRAFSSHPARLAVARVDPPQMPWRPFPAPVPALRLHAMDSLLARL